MRVKLLTDLVQRNNILKAGTTVELATAQATFLIDAGRATEVKVKEQKTEVTTKELKTKKKN